MHVGDFCELQFERAREALWQHRDAVLRALAVADHDFAAREVDVFDTQAHRLEYPHAVP